MGLFWRRKSKDEFVTLGLNEPLPQKLVQEDENSTAQTSAGAAPALKAPVEQPPIEPVATGEGPAPVQPDFPTARPRAQPVAPEPQQQVTPKQKPVPSRSPFATSVLGLNLSIEELQAQEAALEQEFSARFRRAVAATRESLSEKLDTVFQGLKQIDENLLDELEEALIAADIGVATTQHIL